MKKTMEAIHDVVKLEKGRYIGASSMYTKKFSEGITCSGEKRSDLFYNKTVKKLDLERIFLQL
ncbi:hypothetical protein [Gracilibacillus xinjiangensis]|uniref:Uncharacterized protein n=1 Tax=Gracilibacillus xinjiangensis TaxID=1193282 RepID=A0ABV8WU84_9BACI